MTTSQRVKEIERILRDVYPTIPDDGNPDRFNNLPAGVYELVAEIEGQEVLRDRVDMRSPLVDDYRHDLRSAAECHRHF